MEDHSILTKSFLSISIRCIVSLMCKKTTPSNAAPTLRAMYNYDKTNNNRKQGAIQHLNSDASRSSRPSGFRSPCPAPYLKLFQKTWWVVAVVTTVWPVGRVVWGHAVDPGICSSGPDLCI